MEKPAVTPENWRKVYGYYGNHRPSKLALHALHRAASLVYRPRVEYLGGAKQQITELLDADTRLFITSNHLHVMDEAMLSAMIQRGPMRRIIGNTVTPAKQSYFEGRWRQLFDTLGAVPVYRQQDIDGRLSRSEWLEAGKALVRVVADRVEDGASVPIHPEGTRNRENPRELGEVKAGIGRMVLACVEREVPVAIVPVAIWPGDETYHSFTPNMAVGEPLSEFYHTNVRQITAATTEAMTEALHYAQAM